MYIMIWNEIMKYFTLFGAELFMVANSTLM